MSGDLHLAEAKGDRLARSTFQLLVSSGTGVVLGVAFWAVAARLYSKHNVGNGAAEVNAMTLLAALAYLNLGTIFPRFLFAAGARSGSFLRLAYLASTTVGLVAAIVFLLVTRGHHAYIAPGVWPSLFFVAAVVLWVIFTIEDAALVGFRSTFWVPVENTSFSVAKIVLLPIFAVVAKETGVFTSWVLPVIVCALAINLYLWRRVMPQHVLRSAGAGVLPERRIFGKVVLGEYLGGLSFVAMGTLPALFVRGISAQDAAYFQTPWLAGTSFDGLLFAFATSLIVEATTRPTVAPSLVRRSVRLALMILGPAVLVIVVGAPVFLRILDPVYAPHQVRLLQFLALALPFMAVNVLYVTYARLARRVRRVFLVQVSIASTVVTLSYLLIHTSLGITGAGVAFLVGQGIVALVLLPSVVAQYRRRDMAPGFGHETPMVVRSTGTGEAAVTVAAEVPLEVAAPVLRPPTEGVLPVRADVTARAPEAPEVPVVWRRLPHGATAAEPPANDGAANAAPSHPPVPSEASAPVTAPQPRDAARAPHVWGRRSHGAVAPDSTGEHGTANEAALDRRARHADGT